MRVINYCLPIFALLVLISCVYPQSVGAVDIRAVYSQAAADLESSQTAKIAAATAIRIQNSELKQQEKI